MTHYLSALYPLLNKYDQFSITQSYQFKFVSIGQLINILIPAIIVFLGLAIFFFIIYGAFKYLTAGGNKDQISSAQGMIVHAIIGFILFLLLFLVVKYITSAFGLGNSIIQ